MLLRARGRGLNERYTEISSESTVDQPQLGKKGLTLPYMFCLTTRNGRGRLRGTLRLNARQFEADERGWIGRGQI